MTQLNVLVGAARGTHQHVQLGHAQRAAGPPLGQPGGPLPALLAVTAAYAEQVPQTADLGEQLLTRAVQTTGFEQQTRLRVGARRPRLARARPARQHQATGPQLREDLVRHRRHRVNAARNAGVLPAGRRDGPLLDGAHPAPPAAAVSVALRAWSSSRVRARSMQLT
ncbi:hypothetical protein [Streptomyces scabiei]|uniref:hypothetical protein n=1 Tax=Streptomyces scabiei TaxID=1930 RepID=UPI0029A57CB0|nr:hypothetical protein [Streptomyces scabiei]MDX2863194.1 hypothetical protein [Streptomyces scabiei]